MAIDRSVYTPSEWSRKYHRATADEVLGGGSAGPGKSLTLLFDPLVTQAVVEQARMNGQLMDGLPEWLKELCKKHPINPGESEGHALHLRRSMPQLLENIDRSLRMFPKFDPHAVYSRERHCWTFSSGYKFTFGHCRDRDSHQDYLSKQFCVAKGTRILMWDYSLRAIETISVGELVMTLEGPRRVLATWDAGLKPCVEAVVRDQHGCVGRQVHPTTHPVLLWPSFGSDESSSSGGSETGQLAPGFAGAWQDYESLLDGLPESPVTRVSRVDEDNGFSTSDGARLELRQLPASCVPVVLLGPAPQRLEPLAACDDSDARPETGTAKDSTGHCQPADGSHGGPPLDPSGTARARAQQPNDAAGRSPFSPRDGQAGAPTRTRENHVSSYRNFYTGLPRPVTMGAHTGTATLHYVGFHSTWDLSVEGANHYITESGLVNLNTHLGIDESSQFEEFQYEELDGRVRSADPVLSKLLRTRLMSNPAPGWLKKRFVDPHPEGKVVLKAKTIDPQTGEESFKTRLFLPAKLEDNPDPVFVKQYRLKLLSKPAHMRARYLYGDWNLLEGGFFEGDWNSGVHVVEPFKIPRHWPKFRVMDWGYKTQGVIIWMAMDPDDNIYVFYEFNFRMMRDGEVADRVIDIEKRFGFWNQKKQKSRLNGTADTQLWEERGDSGKSKASVFASKGIYWQPADKASIARNAERVSERLRDYDDKKPPGLMVFSNCRKMIEMFAGIAVDPNDSTVPSKVSPLKHWFDVAAYGCARASRGGGSIVMEMHEMDVPEADDEERLPRASGFGYGM